MKTKSIFRLYAVIRWSFYILIISAAFVLSTSLHWRVQPVMLIPIAMCISINEPEELIATGIGAFCGFLIDISFNKLFGYNALILVVMCVLTTLLFKHWLRISIFNMLALCTVLVFIYVSLDFLFYYAIWGYEGAGLVFRRYSFPMWLYTVIFTALIYPVMRLIRLKFQPKRIYHLNNEQTNNSEQ